MASSFPTIVIGGGAAGFFAAIACAEKGRSVLLLEQGSQVLAKVRISGGGRCNVTHACFDPIRLTTFYPRGSQALRGPFTRFQPRDTVTWFESRGVALKTESDGRMFPVSDQSQTIIDCLSKEAERLGVEVYTECAINRVEHADGEFRVFLAGTEVLSTPRLLLATGSNGHAWQWARSLGHTVEPPVPSLFTFTIPDARLKALAGLSVPTASVHLENSKLTQEGPLLITHWGLSGPAVLKLSAWGARQLHAQTYGGTLRVNWLAKEDDLKGLFTRFRTERAKRLVIADPVPPMPRRLWERLAACAVSSERKWADLSNSECARLVDELQNGRFTMTGKSTNKDEFVTCGGVSLDEVNFKTMESKKCPNLYFAGEVLDIDGVTGGFNFQSAWTTGWIAGRAIAEPE